MNDYEIDRAAIQMIDRYGNNAIQKAIKAAEYYLAEDRKDDATRWIKIGYTIKQKLDSAAFPKKESA